MSALVANSLSYEPNDAGGWKPVPDNKLYAIDLQGAPPKLIEILEVGKQPSGIAINKTGDLALVADRADNAVTVLRINGKEVKAVQTIALGDTVSAVAITPDGKHALVTKHAANKVAWLDIDGPTVSYGKHDIAVGVWPYNVQITVDGRFALTVNQGNGGAADGGAGSVSVIDLKANPPHLVDYVTVGSVSGRPGCQPERMAGHRGCNKRQRRCTERGLVCHIEFAPRPDVDSRRPRPQNRQRESRPAR